MLFVRLLLTLFCSTYSRRVPRGHRLARVEHHYLYEADLYDAGLDKEASDEQRKRYIQQWVEKQLIIAAATKKGNYPKAEIERKLLAYRYALLTHAYVEQQVHARLNTTITPEEVAQYYAANRHNFELKDTIAKGRLLIVPRTLTNTWQIRSWLTSNKPEDVQALTNYCQKKQLRAKLDTHSWRPFDAWVQGTPFQNVPDPIRFLRDVKKRAFFRQSDGHHVYYLVVKDYQIKNKQAPLDFVQPQIERTILHQRKTILARQIERELIQQEKKQGNYEIYHN